MTWASQQRAKAALQEKRAAAQREREAVTGRAPEFLSVPGHRLTWAEERPGGYVLECECGETFERTRLADGALALEKHKLYWYGVQEQARRRGRG